MTEESWGREAPAYLQPDCPATCRMMRTRHVSICPHSDGDRGSTSQIDLLDEDAVAGPEQPKPQPFERHPLSTIWGDLSDEEFEDLVESVREHGAVLPVRTPRDLHQAPHAGHGVNHNRRGEPIGAIR